ncbi:uncharacterized protein C8Q71DRAFT_328418 [Rhodofomes roseus]|uniref:Uncharacterized protein n=1 Tax=Rhodofomes roseus TaxID=34475 RepID=A0ABQ8KRI2_9APHY|nr:uncharacterized protein C8Q71DRAFT_328418 [Rhodofomes roseus]KAH9841413.1 hypothetical protein C8Q71DRAFT_328418 [Rhodofomes roseus]
MTGPTLLIQAVGLAGLRRADATTSSPQLSGLLAFNQNSSTSVRTTVIRVRLAHRPPLYLIHDRAVIVMKHIHDVWPETVISGSRATLTVPTSGFELSSWCTTRHVGGQAGHDLSASAIRSGWTSTLSRLNTLIRERSAPPADESWSKKPREEVVSVWAMTEGDLLASQKVCARIGRKRYVVLDIHCASVNPSVGTPGHLPNVTRPQTTNRTNRRIRCDGPCFDETYIVRYAPPRSNVHLILATHQSKLTRKIRVQSAPGTEGFCLTGCAQALRPRPLCSSGTAHLRPEPGLIGPEDKNAAAACQRTCARG